MTTVGVIGTGSMGSALVKGWLRAPAGAATGAAGRDAGLCLMAWDREPAALQNVLGDDRVTAAPSLAELARRADIILVVVKPKDAEEVLHALAGLVGEGHTVISAMAGLTLEWLRKAIGPGPELVRIMPNLGVEVGAGAVVVAAEPGAPDAALERVLSLFRRLGMAEVLGEESFDAVTAVSGSSPAFLAVAIEGLEDGAVAAGVSRAQARAVVRQAALAKAHRLLASGSQTAMDRDSDSATLELLEERGVRGAFRQAVQAAVERSRQMTKSTKS